MADMINEIDHRTLLLHPAIALTPPVVASAAGAYRPPPAGLPALKYGNKCLNSE